jgi:hypothetical protein
MLRRAILATWPALFFLGWALAFTFPLALHATDSVVLSRGGDAWLHMWDLWWVDNALVSLQANPYHTDFILYPTGLNLYYHSLNLLNGLASIPFQRFLGLTSVFNLLVVANLTLDGLAAYWLCRDRTRSTMAALVGGALFASAPLLGTSLDLGQLDELTVWAIPLYVLALFRALESPGLPWRPGGGRRATIAAGLLLAASALATWYFTAGLLVFTAVFVPGYLLSAARREGADAPRWGPSIVKVVIAGAIFVLSLSPLLVAMVRERLSGVTYMLPTLYTTIYNSADLFALFTPPRLDTDLNQHGSTVALGYVALALAAIGLVAFGRRQWPLAAAFLALTLFAMGPHLIIGGNDTGVPLPYAVLNNVPFIGASRQPLRFLATSGVCLSLLAAWGVAALQARFHSPRAAWALAVGLLALVALELFGLPRTLARTGPDAAYRFIKVSSAPGAVLELPFDQQSAPALLHQTYHGRPIVGGYTSRHFPYAFSESVPGVSQLVRADPDPLVADDILDPPAAKTARAGLGHYGVRFVVVNKRDMASGRFGRLADALSAIFTDAEKAFEDGDRTVYQIPDSWAEESPTLPITGLGSGWHRVEQQPLHRWTGSNVTNGDAFVWIGIRPGAEGMYRLALNVYAYKAPQHLDLLLDGKSVREVDASATFQDVSVELGRLAPGDHSLVLHATELPTSPPGDPRTLSIGVTHLAVTRLGP